MSKLHKIQIELANVNFKARNSEMEIDNLKNEVKIESERATHYRDEWQKAATEVRELKAQIKKFFDSVKNF